MRLLLKAVAAVCVLLLAVTGCSKPRPAAGWVDEEVTFVADGLTIHGSYRHQPGATSVPAALLISESGMTDRNGDNAVAGPVGNMRQLAQYLSEHGLASLRYDKVGTGATGLGPYASRRGDVGTAVYTTGAKAALRFLAAQAGVDAARLSVYGLGEGTTRAMALATDTTQGAPRVHALGLLQPLPGRYLDLMTSRLQAQGVAEVKAGAKTPQQADAVLTAWTAAVTQARTAGTVPPGPLPDGLSAILNPGNVKVVIEADRVDPVAEAAAVAAATPVLLTCSDSDAQASCAGIKPLAAALAHTDLTLVQLKGVNHVLRDDPSDNVANYAKQTPLSAQLTDALNGFVGK